jgi:hypothetical protein
MIDCKDILILGDCASSGNLLLVPEITGEKGAHLEYNMTWGGKYHKALQVWYLKQTKNAREKITNLNAIDGLAIQYLKEQEMKHCYWKFIEQKVTNLSKIGATAGGYFRRLQKYETKVGKSPDIIFVTDYPMGHKWQVINHLGKKYFFEKNYDPRRPEFNYNPLLTSTEEVQKIAWEKSKQSHDKGNVEKRNQRVMSRFINYLKINEYNFIKIKFYEGFKEFDNDPNVLDCSDLVKKYTVGNGDAVDVKIEMQLRIAQRIVNKFDWLTLK